LFWLVERGVKKMLRSASLVLCLALVSCAVVGDDPLSGKCGDDCHYEVDQSTHTLTINGTNDMAFFADFGPWHDCCLNGTIETVVIEKGITNIGSFAFRDCTAVTSISIPDSVLIIGFNAFDNCTSLKSVTLPETLTDLNAGAFFGCTSLQSIVIPKQIETIFLGTFSGCTSLASVTLQEGLERIDEGAFEGCSSLSSITIPESVFDVGYMPFKNCDNLKYNEENGGFYLGNDANQYHVLITVGNRVTSFAMNGMTKVIADMALTNANESLASTVIPGKIGRIGIAAFAGCRNLSYVSYTGTTEPNHGEAVFVGCPKLQSVQVPRNYVNKTFCDVPVTGNGPETSSSSSNHHNKKKNWFEENIVWLIPVIALNVAVIVVVIIALIVCKRRHSPSSVYERINGDE